jgi:hypothetical protein
LLARRWHGASDRYIVDDNDNPGDLLDRIENQLLVLRAADESAHPYLSANCRHIQFELLERSLVHGDLELIQDALGDSSVQDVSGIRSWTNGFGAGGSFVIGLICLT